MVTCEDDAYRAITDEERKGSNFGVLYSEEKHHNLRRADFKEMNLVLPNAS
jgi:hypothetical protein